MPFHQPKEQEQLLQVGDINLLLPDSEIPIAIGTLSKTPESDITSLYLLGFRNSYCI